MFEPNDEVIRHVTRAHSAKFKYLDLHRLPSSVRIDVGARGE